MDFIDVNRDSLRIDWPTQHLLQTDPPVAIVMISTSPESKPKREAIRRTWGQWCTNPRVKIVFFMGLTQRGDLRNIFLESQTYDDIVLDDFNQQSKFALSLKTLHMLKWFQDFYGKSKSKPRFIIKADDDMFLHIPNILTHLNSSRSLPSRYLAGSLHTSERVTRDPKSKYYTPTDLLRKPIFPPHLGRCFYILSSDLAKEIFQASFKVPLFHLEDVYITGMIGNATLKVELHDLTGKDAVVEKASVLKKVLQYKTNVWHALAYHGADSYLMNYLYQTASLHVDQRYGA
jgi:hypothetical protein